MYKKINEDIAEKLEKIVGKGNLTQDSEKMIDYGHDEFSLTDIAQIPEMVIKPKETVEVAEIIRLANNEMIPVTPRGGATGLCGGCVPSCGGPSPSRDLGRRSPPSAWS